MIDVPRAVQSLIRHKKRTNGYSCPVKNIADNGKLFIVKVLLQNQRLYLIVGDKRDRSIYQTVRCADYHFLPLMSAIEDEMLCLAHYVQLLFVKARLHPLMPDSHDKLVRPVLFLLFSLCIFLLQAGVPLSRKVFRQKLLPGNLCRRLLRHFFFCGQKGYAAAADKQQKEQAYDCMGALGIKHMAYPAFCAAFPKMKSRRKPSAFAGKIQQSLGIMLLFLHAFSAEYTLVTVHFHILAHKTKGKPDQGIKPVQNQDQQGEAFHPGIPVGNVSALML